MNFFLSFMLALFLQEAVSFAVSHPRRVRELSHGALTNKQKERIRVIAQQAREAVAILPRGEPKNRATGQVAASAVQVRAEAGDADGMSLLAAAQAGSPLLAVAASASRVSASGGAVNASRRTESASTMRSTSLPAPLPSGSLSGLYCATSRPRRCLCLANSMKAVRTSS